MHDLAIEDWEKVFHQDLEQFFLRLKKYLEIQDTAPIRAGLDFLTNRFLYLLEAQRRTDLELLLPEIHEFIQALIYIPNKKPALHVIKGRLEALFEIGEYFRQSTPDPEWHTQMKSKYDQQILIHLYKKNRDQMKRIADALEIQAPQLTPIMDHLENQQFIERQKEGKHVWCHLTRKGYLFGKHLYHFHSMGPAVQLIEDITRITRNKSTPETLEQTISKYRNRYPELVTLLKPLRDLWQVKVIDQVFLSSEMGWAYFSPVAQSSSGAPEEAQKWKVDRRREDWKDVEKNRSYSLEW